MIRRDGVLSDDNKSAEFSSLTCVLAVLAFLSPHIADGPDNLP
jgi:hypothetical protein